jgi:molybdopterin/thiamine biosynthesis adenylyltransferase
VRLDDLQVERYSRQLVLPEIGPAGQERLLAARVAIIGAGDAARRTLGYLAAAGVGKIAALPALDFIADPGQTDVTVEPLAASTDLTLFDAAVLAEEGGVGLPRARRNFWIAGGRAAEIPPCPACAAAALPPVSPVSPELESLRDGLLGTVVATEVMKALLDLGVPLRGHVLSYEPENAVLATSVVPPRRGCGVCSTRSGRED